MLGQFRKAKVDPKYRVAEFKVSKDALLEPGGRYESGEDSLFNSNANAHALQRQGRRSVQRTLCQANLSMFKARRELAWVLRVGRLTKQADACFLITASVKVSRVP